MVTPTSAPQRPPARAVASLRTLLPPPADLSTRVRWALLLFASFFVLSQVVRAAYAVHRDPALHVTVVVLLLALLACWVRGFRRSYFPLPWLVLETVAIGLAVAATSQPVTIMGVLYGAVAFRASYGSWRRAVGYIAVALGAVSLGMLLTAAMGTPVDVAFVLQPMSGVPVMGLMVHLVAVAIARAERAAARERLVSRTGLAIALAEDPDAVRAEGLAAVAALVQDVPGARARIVDGPVPAPSTEAGTCLVLPLRTSDGRLGDLVVHSPDPLPAEVLDALEAIAAQVTMGLSAAALTADLRHRATTDPLTGLANRAAIDTAITAALAAPAPEVAVLLLDLDGFKEVNDVLGHAAGDLVLLTVADRLRAAVRAGDLVGRLGGDEFVVLLRGDGSADDAPALATRLQTDIGRPVPVGGCSAAVGVSVGTAVACPGTTPDELLREADGEMYRVKPGRARPLAAASTTR